MKQLVALTAENTRLRERVASAVQAERERWTKLIQSVASVLDKQLGDTDPNCVTDDGDDMTDDEIKDEYPLLWCCMQLSGAIGQIQKEQPTNG